MNTKFREIRRGRVKNLTDKVEVILEFKEEIPIISLMLRNMYKIHFTLLHKSIKYDSMSFS